MMTLAVMQLALIGAGIPPLRDAERTALMTADDGATRDHREAAFWALLENTARWTGEIGDAAIRLNPDFDAMLAEPDSYRGDLCSISGRLEQIETLLPPYEGVEAWFVRVEGDRPVLVYVDFKGREESRLAFSPGMRVEMAARFYKSYERRADGEGRDQQVHMFPAFVGAFPSGASVEAEADGTSAGIIIPAVIVLGGLFVAALVLAGRVRRKQASHVRSLDSPAFPDEEMEVRLPDDPADALAILRDRAQNGR